MYVEKVGRLYKCIFGCCEGLGFTIKDAMRNAFEEYLKGITNSNDDNSNWTPEEIIMQEG